MSRIARLVVLPLALTVAASAGDYYKWVDGSGTVHLSDSVEEVPPQYRNQIEAGRLAEPPAPVPGPEPPATATDSRQEPGEPLSELPRFEVPFAQHQGYVKRIVLEARLNRRVTARMLLDTGASDSAISRDVAERLGLLEGDKGALYVTAGGIGGTTRAVLVILDQVELGGAHSDFAPATVLLDPSSLDFGDDQYDGLIGMGFVANYNVTIDAPRGVVIFQERAPDPDAPAGHPQEWWRHTFAQFAEYKSGAKQHWDDLRRELRESSGMWRQNERLRRRIPVAEAQYREAAELYDKLTRYAVRYEVPMAWRP